MRDAVQLRQMSGSLDLGQCCACSLGSSCSDSTDRCVVSGWECFTSHVTQTWRSLGGSMTCQLTTGGVTGLKLKHCACSTHDWHTSNMAGAKLLGSMFLPVWTHNDWEDMFSINS